MQRIRTQSLTHRPKLNWLQDMLDLAQYQRQIKNRTKSDDISIMQEENYETLRIWKKVRLLLEFGIIPYRKSEIILLSYFELFCFTFLVVGHSNNQRRIVVVAVSDNRSKDTRLVSSYGEDTQTNYNEKFTPLRIHQNKGCSENHRALSNTLFFFRISLVTLRYRR